jgi:hypothetical protein
MRSAGIAAIIALLVLGACGSGHRRSVRDRTTSTPSRVTTSTAAARTTVTTATTMTTVAATAPHAVPTTAPVAPPSSTVHIDSFAADQPSPVSCNAPTMIELKWTTRGAARVEMHIDGGSAFATYPNGTQDQLLPLTCDGRAHTYELVASAGPERTSKTLTIATKLPS